MARSSSSENVWNGTGDRYKCRGAVCWRVPNDGWYILIKATNRTSGPLSNAITAMQRADLLLSLLADAE